MKDWLEKFIGEGKTLLGLVILLIWVGMNWWKVADGPTLDDLYHFAKEIIMLGLGYKVAKAN